MRRRVSVLAAFLPICLLIGTVSAEDAAVLRMPAGLKIIEEQAFYGDTGLDTVILQVGTETIESKAFAYSSLQTAELPASLRSIADDAFAGCKGLNVKAPEDSYAYIWAVRNDYIPATGYVTLSVGYAGVAVYQMVLELIRQGYFTGDPINRYNSAVEQAVEAFQQANGLPADGVASGKVQYLLYHSVPAEPEEDPEEDPEKDPEENPEDDPEKDPEDNPEDDPEKDPEDNPEDDPEKDPEDNPEDDPEKDPEEKPEDDPEKDPEENPEKDPEENPEDDPEKDPEEDPESDPEENPEDPPKMVIYPAEKVDWNDNIIQELWPKGASVMVYDVKTGAIWCARRWAGGSHIDAEPLTAEDTAILCEIYKVSNSSEIKEGTHWQRRPCLITIGERTFACSLYGVPHNYPDGDTLPDNDFKGQLCFHFTNSMTHGSKRVDPGHQEAIEYAWLNAPNGHK